MTNSDETLWILPTYTCLLELQKIVKSLGYNLAGYLTLGLKVCLLVEVLVDWSCSIANG